MSPEEIHPFHSPSFGKIERERSSQSSLFVATSESVQGWRSATNFSIVYQLQFSICELLLYEYAFTPPIRGGGNDDDAASTSPLSAETLDYTCPAFASWCHGHIIKFQ